MYAIAEEVSQLLNSPLFHTPATRCHTPLFALANGTEKS